MYEKSKISIICPICGSIAPSYNRPYYLCTKCNWNSLKNTVDILSTDTLSAPLSNFFPHKFTIKTSMHPTGYITCLSMESFIQSLRVKDPELQKQICENYAGSTVYKLKVALRDWREDGTVYWQGYQISRFSRRYKDLITAAYNELYNSNDVFRELVLPAFKDKILIHSIGKDDETETLLTELEFRFQLKRLIQRYIAEHQV